MSVHDALLRAAVLDGPEARGWWHTWQSSHTVDDLDSDAQWLLPMLYCNLRDHGVAADELIRPGGVYRHHWYRNLLLLREAELADDAQRVLVVGGAAIALARPDRLGARPFETVETFDATTALFGDPADAELFDRASTVVWRNRSWSLLDPAAQLVLACRRREHADRRSSLLWLADAATVIVRHPTLDWPRVSELSKQTGSADEVAAALVEVSERCGIGTAQQVLA